MTLISRLRASPLGVRALPSLKGDCSFTVKLLLSHETRGLTPKDDASYLLPMLHQEEIAEKASALLGPYRNGNFQSSALVRTNVVFPPRLFRLLKLKRCVNVGR
jgi:hypothetical protein